MGQGFWEASRTYPAKINPSIWRGPRFSLELYADLAGAKSEAFFNIYSFLKENIKSSNTKETVKTVISKKTILHVQHTFLSISLPLFCTTKTWNFF